MTHETSATPSQSHRNCMRLRTIQIKALGVAIAAFRTLSPAVPPTAKSHQNAAEPFVIEERPIGGERIGIRGRSNVAAGDDVQAKPEVSPEVGVGNGAQRTEGDPKQRERTQNSAWRNPCWSGPNCSCFRKHASAACESPLPRQHRQEGAFRVPALEPD